MRVDEILGLVLREILEKDILEYRRIHFIHLEEIPELYILKEENSLMPKIYFSLIS